MSEKNMPRIDMSYEIFREQWEDFKVNVLSQIQEIKRNIERLSDEQRAFLKYQNDIELKREKQIADINLELMSQKKDCEKCRENFDDRIIILEKTPNERRVAWQGWLAIMIAAAAVIVAVLKK